MSLHQLDIKEALTKLASKEISSAQLTQACLERIKAVDKKVQAFLTVDEEGALQAAQAIDERRAKGEKLGVLAGIPLAHKDLFCTKNLRTTAASKILENFVPPYDATVVKRLRAADTVILGKVDCDEFAMGGSGENSGLGLSRNPWDTSRVAGGSSAGSAVAVATDEALCATGTDTGGSIRMPSALCNVTGWKPSYGRVSRSGVTAMASSLDSIGVIAKTVYDAALVASLIAGQDPADSTTPNLPVPPYHERLSIDLRKVKIGVPAEYFQAGLDANVEKVIRAALATYEKLGAQLIDISLPHTKYAIAAYYIICPSEVSANMARYDGIRYGTAVKKADDLFSFYSQNRTSGLGTEVKRRVMLGTYTLSSGYYDAYYRKAQKVRTLVIDDFKQAFQKVDIIATPVSPTVAYKIGDKAGDPLQMYLADAFTVPANLAGLTGLSIPCGFSETLPVGLQLLAAPFAEEKLFAVGHAYQINTDHHTKKPPL